MPQSPIIPRLFGNYLITERLSVDAIGAVYRARKINDPGLFVRLRVFDAPGLDIEPVLDAIEQNGAVHDFLKNPSITKDVDLDSVEGDAFMAYREPGGRTLDQLLKAARERPFPIPVEHCLLIAEKVATGLDHAYNTQIDGERTLHGLVWPGFVEVSDEGEARLGGFGLAEGILASRGTPGIAQTLFPYLAPEVRRSGKPARGGDVYSNAAILYAMLSGSAPPLEKAADSVAATKLLGSSAPLPKEVVNILKTALAESPDSRYPTAGDFRRDVGKLLFSGNTAPSTFNLAFFLSDLFKADIAREQAQRREESAMDAGKYPRPEVTPRPPRQVAAPRFGVPVSAMEDPDLEKKRPGPAVIVGVLVAVAVIAGAILLLRSGSKPSPLIKAAPATARAAAPAPPAKPTAGLTPEEFKAQVQRQLSAQLTQLEAQQKTQQQQQKLANLRPAPTPIAPAGRISAPEPIGGEPSEAKSLPASIPTPQPLPIAARPTAQPIGDVAKPAVKRGDLVPISEVDRFPQYKNVVKPEYPPLARQAGISGTVVLSVLVTEAGRVEDVKIVQDPGGGLGTAAERAVKRWTFTPAEKNGVPVKTWLPVNIPFVL